MENTEQELYGVNIQYQQYLPSGMPDQLNNNLIRISETCNMLACNKSETKPFLPKFRDCVYSEGGSISFVFDKKNKALEFLAAVIDTEFVLKGSISNCAVDSCYRG